MLHHPLPTDQLYLQHESASSSKAGPGFALHDRESESESSKKPTRKRSRVNRRSIYVSLRETVAVKIRATTSQELSESCTEQEPMSSVSYAATAEEEVAFSLMMISRHKWEKEKEEESDYEMGWDKKKNKWVECQTCEKVFKSYQALGGNRASHKKKRTLEGSSSSVTLVSDEKKKKKSSCHKCPICLKVFSSGQALGGHKRSHATPTGLYNSPAKKAIISFINLNLPALSEDEEDFVSSVFYA